MNKLLVFLFLSLFLFSCVNEIESVDETIQDNIYQYSSKNGLLSNDYVGDLTVAKIKENGDFGLGTFNMVDGEMVISNGNVYQVKTDGTVNNMSNNIESPFVVTKFFSSDTTIALPNNIALDSVKIILQDLVDKYNVPLAIKMDAKFKTLISRSVNRVESDSVSLEEIVANQTIFDFNDVDGTVIGFWYPQYFDGVNFPGFHLHVLLDDLSGGGHLLDCTFENATVYIDFASGVTVDL